MAQKTLKSQRIILAYIAPLNIGSLQTIKIKIKAAVARMLYGNIMFGFISDLLDYLNKILKKMQKT